MNHDPNNKKCPLVTPSDYFDKCSCEFNAAQAAKAPAVPTEAQFTEYQEALRAKYDHEWVLSAALAKFKDTPTAATLADATTVMAAHVAAEAKVAAAAKVCGIAHGKAK